MIAKILVASCLILASIIVYFDEFGIVGIIPLLQKHYNLEIAETAIVQTSTSIVHTITLVLIWLFGDSFSRRKLFLTAATVWIIPSFLSIFLGSQSFLIFVALRSLAGAGGVVVQVLTPVLLAGLFRDRTLGVALACVAFGEMVSGMGVMIIDAWIVTNDVPWQSPLIAAPLLAIVPLIGVLCATSSLRNLELPEKDSTTNFAGAFGVFSIKSYILLTASQSFIAFNLRAYNFWFPSMYILVFTNLPDVFLGLSYTTINTLNSLIWIVGTAIGMPTIMWFAQSWRHGTGLFSGRKDLIQAYPAVSSIMSSINTSLFILSVVLLDKSYIACLIVSLFVGITSAPDTVLIHQMTLLVVPPSSRAAAVALSRLVVSIVCIPAAQIVGAIVEAIRGDSTLPKDQFKAYQLGVLISFSSLIISALCHVVLVFVYSKDYKNAEEKELGDERKPLLEKHRTESMESELIVE